MTSPKFCPLSAPPYVFLFFFFSYCVLVYLPFWIAILKKNTLIASIESKMGQNEQNGTNYWVKNDSNDQNIGIPIFFFHHNEERKIFLENFLLLFHFLHPRFFFSFFCSTLGTIMSHILVLRHIDGQID